MASPSGSPFSIRLGQYSVTLFAVIVTTAALSFPLPAYSSQATADGLVGYWKFDETSAGSFTDSSGDGNTGTGNGSSGTNNTPQPSSDVPTTAFTDGRSLSFDGTDDYVTSVGSSIANPFNSGVWTVSTWIKTSGSSIVFGVTKGTDFTYRTLFYTNGQKLQVNTGGGSNSFAIQTTNTSVPNNTWTHCVWVMSSSGLKIYSNGQEQALTSFGGTNAQNTYSGNSLDTWGMGGTLNAATWGFFWPGSLDDVRIYNRALSATEISDLAAGRHTQAAWKGSASTAFENASNWSGSIIPDPYTRVTIPFRANQPTLTGAVAFASLTINTGASLKLNGTGLTLKDSGTFTNYGTLQLKGNETLTSFTNDTNHGTILVYGTGSFTPPSTGLSYYNLNLNDGLVGYWKLDDTSGIRATDSSGYGNSGTLVGGATISSTVAPTNFANARALSFDGTDDSVSLASANKMLEGGIDALSISAWVYPTNVASYYGPIVHKATNALDSGDFLLGFNQGGGTWFIINNGTSASAVAATLSTGRWYHLAGTWSAAEGKMKMYVDGVKGTDATLTGTFTSTTSANLEIGRFYSNYDGLRFPGSIDDVRIYNRALSAGEVAALAAGNQPSLTKATVTLSGNLDVNGDLTMNGGTLDVSSSNYSITVGGKWLNNGGVLNARKGTVTFDGTTSGLEILSGGQWFNTLTFNGAGATWNMRDRLTASGTLTLTAGTLDASGSYVLKAGTISQTSGVFTPRSGIVVLTSPADQTATITSTLNTLRIEDPTENGLVGYWKFDEGTNTGAILDSSGYGNTGTRRGGAGKVWSGSSVPSAIQFDNPFSMQFDGTDDYVDNTNIVSKLSSMSQGTISLWLKRNSGTAYPLSVTTANDSAYLYIWLTSAGVLNAREVRQGQGKWAVYSATTAPTANTWYHVAVIQNGVSPLLYINGLEAGTTSNGGVNFTEWLSQEGTWDAVVFGKDPFTSYHNGLLDDVRIYNRALSANEVANLARGRYASGNSSTATFTLGANLAVSTLGLDSGNLATSSSTLTVTNALQILRGNGSLTLGSVTTTLNGGLTLSGGTLTGGAGTLDINGALSMLTGSLVAPSGTMTVSGNWNRTGGVFTHNSGTVQFDGTSTQTLTGSLIFYNLTKTVASASSFFLAWNGQVSVSGALTLRGASSNLLTVRSTRAGTKASLILDGDTGTQTIDYLNVADNSAATGAVLVCLVSTEGCVNGGNTTNWQIVTPTVSFSGSTLTRSETSGTASLVINLSGSSLIDITIPFSIAGTATGTGADFTILTPSPLILQAGETSTGVLVRFVNDTDIESDETIILTLGTPTNAGTGSTASMTVTLTSDDAAAASSSSSSSAATQGGGGGGHRGSDQSMQEKIALAQQTILAQFQARQQVIAAAKNSGTLPKTSPTASSAPSVDVASLVQRRKQERFVLLAKRAEAEDVLLVTINGEPMIFGDVKVSEWYAPYVSKLIEEGIAEGYKDENDKPKGIYGVADPVTYGEIAKMAVNASGKSEGPFFGTTRNRSAQGTWAAPFIRAAEILGYTVFASSLDVTKPATRGEVIQTILEAMNITIGKKTPASYADVRDTHPYTHAIATATFFGLVEGDRDENGNLKNLFRPNDPISRSEVAKIIAVAKEMGR